MNPDPSPLIELFRVRSEQVQWRTDELVVSDLEQSHWWLKDKSLIRQYRAAGEGGEF